MPRNLDRRKGFDDDIARNRVQVITRLRRAIFVGTVDDMILAERIAAKVLTQAELSAWIRYWSDSRAAAVDVTRYIDID